MKIVIPTIGSRGDVQPFIALASGLEQAGHGVTVATHPVMKALVESHGVRFAPIGPDINLAQEVAAIRHRARNAAMGLIQGMRFGFDMLERSHDDIMVQCRQADLVVVPTAVAAGKNEAELLDLPYLSVTLMPWAIPWDDPERPLFKRIVYRAIDGLVHLITTRPLNRFRKRLGLPPVGEEGFTSPRLNLVPVSPAVYPPNPRWEPRHRIVGYWFADAPDAWAPAASLVSFLEEGDPPVLVSLGAMSLGDDDAFESASLFVNAVQQAGLRAIIQGWEAGIRQMSLPSNIYATGSREKARMPQPVAREEWQAGVWGQQPPRAFSLEEAPACGRGSSLPHGWLLPHCAGIVHHGGFGTTAAGLRAGIPALVIPHIADQFYWGQQVHDLGVGPQPIRRTKLEQAGLVASLEELVQSKSLREKAAHIGDQIRSERGVENAVRLIEAAFS